MMDREISKVRQFVHLTSQTDYALRLLMHLGKIAPAQRTIAELAAHLGISKNHLMKIVNRLANESILISSRGKSGGVCLNEDALALSIGELVEHIEPSLAVVECLSQKKCDCIFVGFCGLTPLFAGARDAFLNHLKTQTLGEIIAQMPNTISRQNTAPQTRHKMVT